MKIDLLNTPSGLKPLYDDDYEEKKKLKIGQTYSAEIKLLRNATFHNKVLKLLRLAWEVQSEAVRASYNENFELFREDILITSGHSERYFSETRQEFVSRVKSISFSSMEQKDFESLYERIKDTLFLTFLRDIPEDVFIQNLSNF